MMAGNSHMGLSIKIPSIHVFANKIVGSYRHNGVKQYKSFMSLGPRNQPPKTALMNLSVEEENLATIPFAVLERRVGKKVGKIEISGTKTLPDGAKVRVVWQVQGN